MVCSDSTARFSFDSISTDPVVLAFYLCRFTRAAQEHCFVEREKFTALLPVRTPDITAV